MNSEKHEVDSNAIKPCPECQAMDGYDPVGADWCQCQNCNALLKKEEVIEDYQENI